MLNPFSRKNTDEPAADMWAFIPDRGTRDAVKMVLKILVPVGVAYAVAGGYIPENQSEAATAKAMDMIAHLMELGVIASACITAWRHAHTKEREVLVAQVKSSDTPRDQIHALAKSMDVKDIAAMMPPPESPR